jgi:hypothetical protein
VGVSLALDWTSKQIEGGAKGSDVVSLLLMNDEATLVFEDQPIDWLLFNRLQELKKTRPRSHGNYIPALGSAEELLLSNTNTSGRCGLLLLCPMASLVSVCMVEKEHGIVIERLRNETTDNEAESARYFSLQWGRRRLHSFRAGQDWSAKHLHDALAGTQPVKNKLGLHRQAADAAYDILCRRYMYPLHS